MRVLWVYNAISVGWLCCCSCCYWFVCSNTFALFFRWDKQSNSASCIKYYLYFFLVLCHFNSIVAIFRDTFFAFTIQIDRMCRCRYRYIYFQCIFLAEFRTAFRKLKMEIEHVIMASSKMHQIFLASICIPVKMHVHDKMWHILCILFYIPTTEGMIIKNLFILPSHTHTHKHTCL